MEPVLLLGGLVVVAMVLVMLRIKQGAWVLGWKLRGLFIVAASGLWAVAFEWYARLLGW